jgi:hypothetical protein
VSKLLKQFPFARRLDSTARSSRCSPGHVHGDGYLKNCARRAIG